MPSDTERETHEFVPIGATDLCGHCASFVQEGQRLVVCGLPRSAHAHEFVSAMNIIANAVYPSPTCAVCGQPRSAPVHQQEDSLGREASSQHEHEGESRVVAEGTASGSPSAALAAADELAQITLEMFHHAETTAIRNDRLGGWAALEKALAHFYAARWQPPSPPSPSRSATTGDGQDVEELIGEARIWAREFGNVSVHSLLTRLAVALDALRAENARLVSERERIFERIGDHWRWALDEAQEKP